MKVFQVFKDEEDPTNKGSHDAHEGKTGACLSSSEPPWKAFSQDTEVFAEGAEATGSCSFCRAELPQPKSRSAGGEGNPVGHREAHDKDPDSNHKSTQT